MSEAAALLPYTDAPPAGAGKLYEVVDGKVVEPPLLGSLQTRIASILSHALYSHADRAKLGRVDSEMLFLIDPARNLQRRPDISFVSYERWAEDRPVFETPAWDVVPDLAVEIVSPSNSYTEVVRKVREYFKAGVRQVWVVVPSERQLTVFLDPKRATILDDDDTLDGGDVLPGFGLKLADLFAKANLTAP